MAHRPTRLGLVATRALAKEIIRIVTKFRTKMEEWLTSEQFQKVIDLLECAQAVFDDVPAYPPDPE